MCCSTQGFGGPRSEFKLWIPKAAFAVVPRVAPVRGVELDAVAVAVALHLLAAGGDVATAEHARARVRGLHLLLLQRVVGLGAARAAQILAFVPPAAVAPGLEVHLHAAVVPVVPVEAPPTPRGGPAPLADPAGRLVLRVRDLLQGSVREVPRPGPTVLAEPRGARREERRRRRGEPSPAARRGRRGGGGGGLDQGAA